MNSCFMCLENSRETLNIFFDAFKCCPVDIIKSFFWFTPTIDDPIICVNCWRSTEAFHEFYLKVKEAHNTIKTEAQPSDLTLTIDEIEIYKHEPVSDDSRCSGNSLFLNQPQLSVTSVASISDEIENYKEETVSDNSRCSLLNDSDVKEDNTMKINDENELNCITEDKNKKNLSKTEQYEEYDKKVANFVTLNCAICSLTLSTFGKLKTHFKKAHNSNGYAICCNRKYYKRSLLLDHIDTHINPEHFKCPICSKTFTIKKSHVDHVATFHKNDRIKYTCSICNKEFSSTSTLKAHKRTHNPKEEWSFKCKYAGCDKIYASREFLASHVHSVHKKITKICDLCGKTLDSKTFRKHMQKHSTTVQEKVECHICNSFLHKKYIKIHLKNHEEANMDHICPTCGKKSPNGKALYKHIYEVHRIKKFHPCTVCNKPFKSKDLLHQHMPVHTGENNYKCTFCSRFFKFKSNMHDHKKKEHSVEFEEERRNRIKMTKENQFIVMKNLES